MGKHCSELARQNIFLGCKTGILRFIQFVISAVSHQQFKMIAAFGYAAVIQHDYLICIPDG